MSIERLNRALKKAKSDVVDQGETILISIPHNGRDDSDGGNDWHTEGEDNDLILVCQGGDVVNRLTVKALDESKEVLQVIWCEDGKVSGNIKNPLKDRKRTKDD